MNFITPKFDTKTQTLIGLYALFIAFPVIDIPLLGISLTFPIFLLLCYRIKTRYSISLFTLKKNLIDALVLLFFIIAGTSIAFAPPADLGGTDLAIKDIKNLFYLSYWLCVYAFFKNVYSRIDISLLSRYGLLGLLLSIIVVLFGHKGHGYFNAGPLNITTNSFAFNTVACLGFASIYLLLRYGWRVVSIQMGILAYSLLYADSRSGAIIILAQGTFLAILSLAQNSRKLRSMIMPIFIMVMFPATIISYLYGNNIEESISSAGSLIEEISPKLSSLLIDRNAALERDKSWLVRLAQVDKSLDLFQRYPILGVGWGHFTHVRGHIDVQQYIWLNDTYDSYALTRSSHNSYMQVLAETGFTGFVIFVFINAYVLIRFFASFRRPWDFRIIGCLGISLLGTSVYFWTISAVSGAVWYFILGLFIGELSAHNKTTQLKYHPR